MQKSITASVIIPSLGRSDSLQTCLESLRNQTFKDFEVITVTEEGPLAGLRNKGARLAKGEYLVFIDDDVFTHPYWLRSIVDTFRESRNIGGVSGPSCMARRYRLNRDIFRYHFFKWLYDFIFCRGRHNLPGHITKSGAWTTGANNPACRYDGPVDFLEACNMAFRADVFNRVGGFDENYKGVGDWSEPDLAFRIKKLGYQLWFSRNASLEHRPSKSGAYKKRRTDAPNRMANYELFSKRWVKPCFEHTLYKLFLKAYYATQTIKRYCFN